MAPCPGGGGRQASSGGGRVSPGGGCGEAQGPADPVTFFPGHLAPVYVTPVDPVVSAFFLVGVVQMLEKLLCFLLFVISMLSSRPLMSEAE